MTPKVTVILAIYDKASETRHFPALYESLLKQDHRDIVLVTYDEVVDETEIGVLRAIPGVSIMRASVDRMRDPEFVDLLQRKEVLDSPASLMAWARGVQLVPMGRPFVALDLSTIALRPLDEIIPKIQPHGYTLALSKGLTSTGRPRVYPDVLYGVAGPLSVRTMNSVWREALKILGQGDLPGIERTYGSALSAAYLLAKSKADEGGGAVFGTIPGGWVVSEDSPLLGSAGIVRFTDDLR